MPFIALFTDKYANIHTYMYGPDNNAALAQILSSYSVPYELVL